MQHSMARRVARIAALLILVMSTSLCCSPSDPSSSRTNGAPASRTPATGTQAGDRAWPSFVSPQRFPVDRTDLSAWPRLVFAESPSLGAPPRVPWLGTGVRRGGLYAPTLHWRGRTTTYPVNFYVHGLIGSTVIGTYGQRVQLRAFNGAVRQLAKASGLASVAAGAEVGLATWRVDKAGRIDDLFWAKPDGPRQQVAPPDLGVVDRDWVIEMWWAGALAPSDLIYRVDGRKTDSSDHGTFGYFRTSGSPAQWHLSDIGATSSDAGLIAGSPDQMQKDHCVAVYRADAPRPLWTRCFTRRGRASRFDAIGFTQSGRKLVGLVAPRPSRAGSPHRTAGPATLVVLDSLTGVVRHRIDRDFGSHTVVLEDRTHVVFATTNRPPDDPMTEASFDTWLVRCSLNGACEPITERIRTNNFAWPLRPLLPSKP